MISDSTLRRQATDTPYVYILMLISISGLTLM
jgi:hypothetical protein